MIEQRQIETVKAPVVSGFGSALTEYIDMEGDLFTDIITSMATGLSVLLCVVCVLCTVCVMCMC